MERIDDLQWGYRCSGFRHFIIEQLFYHFDLWKQRYTKRRKEFRSLYQMGIVYAFGRSENRGGKTLDKEIQRRRSGACWRSVAFVRKTESISWRRPLQNQSKGQQEATIYIYGDKSSLCRDLQNPLEKKNIARHGWAITLDVSEAARCSYLALKGEVLSCASASEWQEIIRHFTGKERGLEPKRLQMVHSFDGEKASFSFWKQCRELRGASVYTLILYREKGVYSRELLEIYGMDASGEVLGECLESK